MTCKLLLVDDHSLIRAGVRALVSDIPGYTVIGEANDGNQLPELVRRLDPDIVLLDISMRSTSGLVTTRRGLDKNLYEATIVLAVIFVLSILTGLFTSSIIPRRVAEQLYGRQQ